MVLQNIHCSYHQQNNSLYKTENGFVQEGKFIRNVNLLTASFSKLHILLMRSLFIQCNVNIVVQPSLVGDTNHVYFKSQHLFLHVVLVALLGFGCGTLWTNFTQIQNNHILLYIRFHMAAKITIKQIYKEMFQYIGPVWISHKITS